MSNAPRRPTYVDPASLDEYPAAFDNEAKTKAAHRSAWLLVEGAQRSDDQSIPEKLRTLADEQGLELLAELWSGSSPDSLPGALWRLYVTRTWVHRSPAEASEQYEAGRSTAPVMEILAGVPAPCDPQSVRHMLDEVLGGVAVGDLAITFERAAAFLRIVAAGRACLSVDLAQEPPPAQHPDQERCLVSSAGKLLDTAEHLERAAEKWRLGELANQ